MRSAIVSLIFAVLILGAGIGISGMITAQKQPAEKLPATNNAQQVAYKIAAIENLSAQIEVNGRLRARDRVEIFSEVSGTYRGGQKPFKEGVYFREGEVLLNMSDQEFDMNLRAQKSALMNQITLMLPDMKSDYPVSFGTWIAYLDSIDLGQPLPALPLPQTDQEKYYLTAKNIQNLFYSIRSQEARMSKYRIYAPFSGKVSQSNITEGTLVRAGQKLGEFFNPYAYEMEAAVSLTDLPYIRSGSPVTLRSEDIAGSWTGKVLRISDVIDPQTQTIRVFIAVSGSSLKEGMYLTGTVIGKELNDVLGINRGLLMDDNSIFIAEQTSAGTDSTMAEGLLKKITVEPVQFSDTEVMIKGVSNGTKVINQSVPAGYDGMKVNLFEANYAAQ